MGQLDLTRHGLHRNPQVKLLNKRKYLNLLSDSSVEITPETEVIERALDYAGNVFPTVGLTARKLKRSDLRHTFQNGKRLLCHVRAFPRKNPDTFLIVILGPRKIEGHILIDLAAEYSAPFLSCVATGYQGTPDRKTLEKQIRSIDPDQVNPFAILSTGEGTYMQTYREEKGFILEYQLVNTSSHYEIPKRATEDQVVAAMLSYAFGKYEWLDDFAWRRQKL